MKISPAKEDFLRLSREGNLVPVYADLMADAETPVSVYGKLSQDGPAYLLESVEGGTTLNRYSFIGCQPRLIVKSHWDRTVISERDSGTRTVPTPDDPLEIIKEEMAKFKPVDIEGMPRFIGGAVGFISYEYVHSIEPTVPLAEKDPLQMPVTHFLITDQAVIFDRANQTVRLLVNAHIESPEQADAAYEAARSMVEDLAKLLAKPSKLQASVMPEIEEIPAPRGNFQRAKFEAMVEDCKEYIRAGDIIQVVVSQRFEEDFPGSPLDLYRALRTVNPSPYMFLLDTGESCLVGASPEVHVRLTDGKAEMRPIAGTRPRGANRAEDRAFQEDLLSDEKELAEHLMLVDLARNDLGRVCAFGSVTVPERETVERYSHVMHIVSQVEGKLDPKHDAYDLLRATFPAGTVSGAPKVRAMQIIAEKEPDQRGPYAGALGYFSYDGNLDSCIAIRTSILKDGKVHFQSGAGIVADSVPANEFMETINKAKGMNKAIQIAKRLRPS